MYLYTSLVIICLYLSHCFGLDTLTDPDSQQCDSFIWSDGSSGQWASFPDWEIWRQFEYSVVTELLLDQSDAEAQCVRCGGHLTSVLTDAEHFFLNEKISDTQSEINTAYWIGLENSNPSVIMTWLNDWGWLDGGAYSPSRASHWASGEPSTSSRRERCVVMRAGEWRDVTCDTQRPFICKRLIRETPTTTTATPSSEKYSPAMVSTPLVLDKTLSTPTARVPVSEPNTGPQTNHALTVLGFVMTFICGLAIGAVLTLVIVCRKSIMRKLTKPRNPELPVKFQANGSSKPPIAAKPLLPKRRPVDTACATDDLEEKVPPKSPGKRQSTTQTEDTYEYVDVDTAKGYFLERPGRPERLVAHLNSVEGYLPMCGADEYVESDCSMPVSAGYSGLGDRPENVPNVYEKIHD